MLSLACFLLCDGPASAQPQPPQKAGAGTLKDAAEKMKRGSN